jgi:hypothetical protein
MVLDRARSKGSVLRKRLSETPKSVPVMAGPHKQARLAALMIGLSRIDPRFRQMTIGTLSGAHSCAGQTSSVPYDVPLNAWGDVRLSRRSSVKSGRLVK